MGGKLFKILVGFGTNWTLFVLLPSTGGLVPFVRSPVLKFLVTGSAPCLLTNTMSIKLVDLNFPKVLVFPLTVWDRALSSLDVQVGVLDVGLPASFRVENFSTCTTRKLVTKVPVHVVVKVIFPVCLMATMSTNFFGGSHEGPTVGLGGLGSSVPPLLPFPFPFPLPLGMAPDSLLDLVTLLDVAPSSSGSTSAGLLDYCKGAGS